MATLLTKPVRRKLNAVERRGIVVTLYPNATLGLRVAKTRTEHVVPVGRIYRLAVEMSIEAARIAKERAKNGRRAERGLPPLPRFVKRGKL